MDFTEFWKADALSHQNNCFNVTGQTALGIRMSDECVFAELEEEGTPWKPIPRERRIELNKRYNDKSEKIVGLRLLREELPPEDSFLPQTKRIGEVFGGEYVYYNDTEWLTQSAKTPEELEALLDRVDRLDLREFMLPPEWEAEKKRVYEKYGIRPDPLRGVRGPMTLACSIYGNENMIFLGIDEPDLYKRFSDTILRVLLGMAEVMDEEAGVTPETAPGFAFMDDSSCLFTPELYREFGFPILKAVFEKYAPKPEHSRYQHSDSPMGHLLPILGELDLNGCNFGPTVMIPEIRQYLPHARIDGALAPFTFMHNDREKLREEVLRDIAYDQQFGGVNIATAGSINNGSLLSSMRYIMELIWENRK